MPSTINASNSGAGGLISAGDASGVLALQTAGTTAITVDTSQNVGIGTSSPATKLDLNGAMTFRGDLQAPASQYIYSYEGSSVGFLQAGLQLVGSSQQVRFWSNNVERMRIDSSGNLQIGTTSNPQSTRLTLKYGSSANWGVGPLNNGSIFYVINDGGTGVQLTSGNQAWAAQSDERVKTDLVSIENGLAKVATLRAVVGRLKNDESGRRLPFLIAQDVQAVLPEAVDTGEDEDATLSLRYTDVIPLLVASIQELKAINDTQAETINALTARIVALEGK